MAFFWYNKGTKERKEQKMLISFKIHGEHTDEHIKSSQAELGR